MPLRATSRQPAIRLTCLVPPLPSASWQPLLSLSPQLRTSAETSVRLEIVINTKIVIDGKATAAFNEREKLIKRLKFITINPDKLTVSQIDLFKLI